ATFRRLYEGNGVLAVMQALIELERALLEKASHHLDTVMPGYTHLQPSQPWVFGHYLIGFADKLHGDFQRLDSAYNLILQSPLGTVGGNGTSWPIDRRRTAELLGFLDIVE